MISLCRCDSLWGIIHYHTQSSLPHAIFNTTRNLVCHMGQKGKKVGSDVFYKRTCVVTPMILCMYEASSTHSLVWNRGLMTKYVRECSPKIAVNSTSSSSCTHFIATHDLTLDYQQPKHSLKTHFYTSLCTHCHTWSHTRLSATQICSETYLARFYIWL